MVLPTLHHFNKMYQIVCEPTPAVEPHDRCCYSTKYTGPTVSNVFFMIPVIFARVYSGCQQRPYSTDEKGRHHSPLSPLQFPGAAHSSIAFHCHESPRGHGSKQQSRGVTFPGSRRHSRQRGPHSPRETRTLRPSRVRPVTLTPAPAPEADRGKQRRRGTHRAEEGPLPRTQAAAGHEQRREAATAAAPAPQQQAAVSHGGLGPLPGARRHGAKAGERRRPAAFSAYRFSGNWAPPAQETRGGTRTHAPHAYVRPRPGVRTSTCPRDGRPRPRVGRGWSAQSAGVGLEAGPNESGVRSWAGPNKKWAWVGRGLWGRWARIGRGWRRTTERRSCRVLEAGSKDEWGRVECYCGGGTRGGAQRERQRRGQMS